MLSAANLTALEDEGLSFIVGSKTTKAPGDLESHFTWNGTAFGDGQVIDTITPKTNRGEPENSPLQRAEPVWDPARHTASWRAVWAYKHTRALRDRRTLARAKKLVGLKGYVTNIPVGTLAAEAVVRSGRCARPPSPSTAPRRPSRRRSHTISRPSSTRSGTGPSSRTKRLSQLGLDYGLSNGLIESTNTKIRLLTRIAFGFRSPEALIALALLALGGYRPSLPERARPTH
jgi:Transposase